MKVVGLDISKSSAVALLLESPPQRIKRDWQHYRTKGVKLTCDRSGVDILLSLSPSVVVMEPTGYHYSEFWRIACERHNIQVIWVGHMEVANTRRSNKLPNKNDLADAYALACYYWLHEDEPEFFLSWSHAVMNLRQYCLQIHSLHRGCNPLVNRLRQQLAHEFPEAALMKTKDTDEVGPLWRWLRGDENAYYQRLWDKSIAQDLGMSISPFSRFLATQICDQKNLKLAMEADLEKWVHQLEFAKYNRVFSQLGMGVSTKAWLLGNIYPIEQFRYHNEGRIVWNIKAFKLKLGMGLVTVQSGDVEKIVPGGSAGCRRALFLWGVRRIACDKFPERRPKSLIAQEVCDFYDEQRSGECKSPKLKKLAICRAVGKATRVIFRELIGGGEVDEAE